MDKKNLKSSRNGRCGTIGQSLRQVVALVAALSLLLAPVAWADARTQLKPGWNMFSPQQDTEVGLQASKDAEHQVSMMNDSRVDNYLNNLGHRLSAHAPGYQFQYTYKGVNDPAINAFALPGGHVYINRGTIEAADNEVQLAAVMAHETSHVALRHGTNQASKASAAQLPLGILGALLGTNSTGAALAQLGAGFTLNSLLLKYSRTDESEADIMGTQILYDSGYDPRGMGQFLEKIQALDQGNHRVAFFSDHPSPDRRVERVAEEVANLGGAPSGYKSNSREFDDIKRYIQSMPGPPSQGGQLQGSGNGGQGGTSRLQILTASYGAQNRFVDVRQLLQSRVQNDRLDFQLTNASMGGDPISNAAKTLQINYQWAGRAYDVAARENQRVSIPTQQQQNETGARNGTQPDWPSGRFKSFQNSILYIDYPDNWQASGQGDAASIAPRGGLVDDGNGNQALAYGVIVNIYQPHVDSYGQQLQGRDYGQGSGQNSAQGATTALEQATDQLVAEFRLSNRNMRVIRYHEGIGVNGENALSTYLSNDSPIPGGSRETDWLITLPRSDGLLVFIVFTAPERAFQGYESTFQQMLRSVRINR
jgi:beta-barrel assembly-enhancing protease